MDFCGSAKIVDKNYPCLSINAIIVKELNMIN